LQQLEAIQLAANIMASPSIDSDAKSTSTFTDEKIAAPPHWIHPNGNRKAKRKEDGPMEIICRWTVKHQIGMCLLCTHFSKIRTNILYSGLSINLLMLLFLTHACFPRVRNQTRKFFTLSYYNPDSGKYSLGPNDAWMVFYWVVVFTGLRAAVMDYVLTPLAKKGGIKKQKDQVRFCEQAWLFIYALLFWSFGMVGNALFDLEEIWS